MSTQLMDPALQKTTSHASITGHPPFKTNLIQRHVSPTQVAKDAKPTMRTWRFWAIIASLMITGLISALEGTIITSALPTITDALSEGNA
jgi:hypothetical protein